MAELSPEEYAAYIRKHALWNFVVNILDVSFFMLAMSFIFGATVLSLYSSYLTSSAVLIGLIATIQSIGYSLPQLLMARKAEQLDHKKTFVQRLSIMERLPYLFVGLSILLWPNAPRWLAFVILALGMATATSAGGLASPAWNAMLAKVVPAHRRGLLFGLMRSIGGLMGVGGAALSRRVLSTYTYPISFGICFLLCFVFQVLSWVCLSLNREPRQRPAKAPLGMIEYWRKLPHVLKGNPNFLKYLGSQALLIFGTMGVGFYVVYARQKFGVDDAFAAELTMAALISQTVSTPILGWLADRRGHKWLSEVCALIGIAALVTVLVAPDVPWLFVVFMLSNAATTGMAVANQGITMEFGSLEDLPTFVALAGTISAIPITLAPLIGGWIVDWAGYHTLFWVAMGFMGAGWLSMSRAVVEPRYHSRARLSTEAQPGA
ncbi:MAG: MFS transporter [Chloroflexi bacterium]|nr:MFS transporter [Chloroflexota bacterium]